MRAGVIGWINRQRSIDRAAEPTAEGQFRAPVRLEDRPANDRADRWGSAGATQEDWLGNIPAAADR